MLKSLSEKQRMAGVGAAGVIILLAVWSLLSQIRFGPPESISGGFAIQVNPATSAAQDPMADMVFGFERLVLNGDHTFRLGALRGNWKRSGDTLSLSPTSTPPADQFYAKTSMAQTLTILLKPCDFKISDQDKKLTAANPANGDLVFTKVNDLSKDLG